MVDVTASLDNATQQILALLEQIRLSNVRFIAAQDIGAADACQFAPVPNVMSYGADLVLVADIAAPNLTTAPRLTIQGLGSVPIQALDGSAPAIGAVAGKRLIGFSTIAGGGFAARLLGTAPADLLALIAAGFKASLPLITLSVVGTTMVPVPAGATYLDIPSMSGGGGGGGGVGSAGNGSGSGGGGGTNGYKNGIPVGPGTLYPTVVPMTVGAGGAAGGFGGAGGNGGTTSVGSSCSVPGGAGGSPNATGNGGAGGGAGTGCDGYYGGGYGTAGLSQGTGVGGPGGGCSGGGQGGGGAPGIAAAGTQPGGGGGGSGSYTTNPGGAGAPGEIKYRFR